MQLNKPQKYGKSQENTSKLCRFQVQWDKPRGAKEM